MIFIGYEARSKAYRVYDPTTRRVHIRYDVVFDEGAQWAWHADHDGGDVDFTINEPMEAPTVVTTTSAHGWPAPPLNLQQQLTPSLHH